MVDPASGGAGPAPAPSSLPATFRRVLLLTGLLWTAVCVGSLAYHVVDVRGHVVLLARNEADESIAKDLIYRSWAAGHGGVYVPATEATPPNPLLAHVPERDVTTPSGRMLTLLNPAYMTRQVHELGQARGVWGHITSRRPVRPENAPDAWELQALAAFEGGAQEYGEVVTLGGEPHYRFMRPLSTEAPCLRCHAADGYRLGDLRGGISVAVPMAAFAGAARKHLLAEGTHFGVVWALGIVGLLLAAPFGRRRIAEREAAEAALKRNLEFTRSLVENDPECLKTIGPGGELTFMNPAGLAMIEAEGPDAVVGKPVLDLVAPAHREAFDALTRRVLAGESGSLEFEIVGLKGRRRWMETRAVPLRDASGAVEAVLALTRDVTARRGSEEALRASEERFRALFEGAPDAIFLADPESGEIVEANEAATRLTQRPRAELIGMPLASLRPPGDGAEAPDAAADRAGEAEPPHAESEVLRPDGVRVPVLVGARVMNLGGRRLAMSVLRDVSEQKEAEAQRARLEAQLLQAQKLESVGRLAGGVAHDFNNMLQAIAGYTHLALRKVPPEGPVAANLREIERAAERSADLTRQLLTFARRQAGSPRPLDLNAAISGTLGMLRRLIGESVEVSWTPGGGLWPVRMDPAQADQILVNLGVNARDAIGGVGRIAIETRNVPRDETPPCALPGCAPGDRVLLRVSDTGRGLGPEARAHIFEPFFTTKRVGEGSGLGLAIVYGIVTGAGGSIDVRSEAGRGTTFSILLPRCAEDPGVPADAPRPALPRGGDETVLLVEDEGAVRAVGAEIVRNLGYTVLVAESPQAALRLAEGHAGRIDLLVTDVVMPGMDGRELARRVRALRPGLRVLLMSGHAAEVVAAGEGPAAAEPLLGKPFSAEQLAARIREVLDREAGG